MPKFEVCIVYRGTATFVEEASSADIAQINARMRYNDGETGDIPVGDEEIVISTSVKRLPEPPHE